MVKPEAENQPPASSLVAVSDAQLFRYVTHKNLVKTADAMKRRARQLRPSAVTLLRCVWYELKAGQEAAAELTRRTAIRDSRIAEAYADTDPNALLGGRVIFRSPSADRE